MSRGDYEHAIRRVLLSNFWGELLLGELVSRLLAGAELKTQRRAMGRIALDEARHTHLVRRLLSERGMDPFSDGSRSSFAYEKLFRRYGEGSLPALLAFLAEFEGQSGPTFGTIVSVATEHDDGAVVSVYGEVLNDEVRHAQMLDALVAPLGEEIAKHREEARQAMSRCFNRGYMMLNATRASRRAVA